MAEEMVKIGCKLPQGMVLEVGYSVVAQGKDGSKSISLQQHDDYMRVRIKGWTHVDGSKQAYHSGLLLPPNTSLSNPQVAVTDVPAAFFARRPCRSSSWASAAGRRRGERKERGSPCQDGQVEL